MADAFFFFNLFFLFCGGGGGGSENVQEFTLQLLEVEIFFFVDKSWLKPKVLLGQEGLEMDYGPPFFL